VDRDPVLFPHVLAWLRSKRVPPAELRREMIEEADYYGLAGLTDALKASTNGTQFPSFIPW
jgi:hypothetical protein